MKAIYFLTGASRGIGAGILAALDSADFQDCNIITISRNPPQSTTFATCSPILADLSRAEDLEKVAQNMQNLLEKYADCPAFLIHNAANLQPMAPVGAWCELAADNLADFEAHLRLNIGAACFLSDVFLRAPNPQQAARRLLFLSSGAAKKAYAGWAMYGAAKAALSHFARTIAEEARQSPHIRATAIAPGVVDTAMQHEIRAANPQHFPNQTRFIALHQNHNLQNPKTIGKMLVEWIHRDDFGETPDLDLRDLI